MINSELVDTGVKMAPPVLISGGYFLGISWENWVLIATFVYTVLQIGDWFYTKIKLWRANRGNHK